MILTLLDEESLYVNLYTITCKWIRSHIQRARLEGSEDINSHGQLFDHECMLQTVPDNRHGRGKNQARGCLVCRKQ